MATKRKPLAERVTWRGPDASLPFDAECRLAGLLVSVTNDDSGIRWSVTARPFVRLETFKANGWEKAKKSALRIVQAAVLAAAAEWKD